MPIINSHNSWSKLEEVWLGDVYPRQWYDHLPAQTRDAFWHLTEITKEDLNKIEHTLKSFGVTVRRPVYESIDQYLQKDNGQLVKPQICPRDQYLALGNSLLAHTWHTRPWKHVLSEYSTHSDCEIILNTNLYINGANVVRLGNSLIIDSPPEAKNSTSFFDGYQCHWVNNGGHLDGCFAILKPGLLIANHYFPDYDLYFPTWTKIFLDQPEFAQVPHNPLYNGKWWLPSLNSNQSFSEHILKHAQDWVGNYAETYFELNCLVIDESNVLMLGENSSLEKTLKNHGITVHWLPFRARGFWDGGLHCLTVDIRRQSTNSVQILDKPNQNYAKSG
jgi:hypothetical protein